MSGNPSWVPTSGDGRLKLVELPTVLCDLNNNTPMYSIGRISLGPHWFLEDKEGTKS